MNAMFAHAMKTLVLLVVVGIVVLIALGIMWSSITVYIEPGQMGVVTRKTGKPLEEGQILANPGQKGVQAAVLAEGRHFINPLFTKVDIHPCYEIPPGKIGVVTSKVGNEPPQGAILANDAEKGIWRRVLTPGRHRLNPVGYLVDICDAVVIIPGYVGMMTTQLGKETTNRFARTGEMGLLREILQPGIYYVNPREIKVLAVEIGINQVTFSPPNSPSLLYHTTPLFPGAAVVRQCPDDCSVQPEAILCAETPSRNARSASSQAEFYDQSYSAKQKQESAKIMAGNYEKQIGQQGVEVAHKAPSPVGTSQPKGRLMPAAISFPSKDGFSISLDATIEWELLPRDVAAVVAEFGDVAAVEDKIIIPQSQSIGRLQGSSFGVKDFLLGEEREKFQAAFRNQLHDVGMEKNIVIHSAFIRNIILPQELLTPIRERYIAKEKETTSKVWQATKRKSADLQREKSLVLQRTTEVEAKTEALVNVVRAEQQQLSEQIAASTRKMVAEQQMEIATLDAQRAVTLGEAQADIRQWLGEADAQGFQMKVQAFGDPQSYTKYQVAQRLDPNLKIRVVHTGTGTLWTDLEKTVGAAAAGTVLKSAAGAK